MMTVSRKKVLAKSTQSANVTNVGDNMKNISLSEFTKVHDSGTLSIYWKKLDDVEGIIYNYSVVFGKDEGKPYEKFPLIRGILFIDDPFHELHEKYWNEKGYHLDIDTLPKYRYYLSNTALSDLALSTLSVTKLANIVEPFFGDIKE